MAGLLLWTVVAFPSAGCLVPQDDEVLPDLPPQRNSPPRILREATVPANRKLTVNTGAACKPTFSVSVEDTDFDPTSQTYKDTLRSRWFIDPNNEYTSTPGSIVREGNPVAPGTSLVRVVEAPPQLIAALAGLSNEHRVEVWVTDGEFVEFSEPPPGGLRVVGKPAEMPDGSTLENPAFYDSHEWLVTVEGGCPPP